jgi:hypothetical protein
MGHDPSYPGFCQHRLACALPYMLAEARKLSIALFQLHWPPVIIRPETNRPQW